MEELNSQKVLKLLCENLNLVFELGTVITNT